MKSPHRIEVTPPVIDPAIRKYRCDWSNDKQKNSLDRDRGSFFAAAVNSIAIGVASGGLVVERIGDVMPFVPPGPLSVADRLEFDLIN